MTIDRGVESARQALKVAFGVVPFLAGLDKFFNLLADWPRYLSPAASAGGSQAQGSASGSRS